MHTLCTHCSPHNSNPYTCVIQLKFFLLFQTFADMQVELVDYTVYHLFRHYTEICNVHMEIIIIDISVLSLKWFASLFFFFFKEELSVCCYSAQSNLLGKDRHNRLYWKLQVSCIVLYKSLFIIVHYLYRFQCFPNLLIEAHPSMCTLTDTNTWYCVDDQSLLNQLLVSKPFSLVAFWLNYVHS